MCVLFGYVILFIVSFLVCNHLTGMGRESVVLLLLCSCFYSVHAIMCVHARVYVGVGACVCVCVFVRACACVCLKRSLKNMTKQRS